MPLFPFLLIILVLTFSPPPAASGTPSNADDFKSTCAAQGKRSRCCTLPLAGLAVLCSDP